jgi:hypothetical protein
VNSTGICSRSPYSPNHPELQVLLDQRQPDVFLSLEPNSLVKWQMFRVVEQKVDERTMTVIGKTPSGGPISLAIE